MTKTLTEQWREGTLERGYYYCKLYYNDFEPRIQECVKSRYDSKSCIPMSCGCEGEEVLAPVPSYDEHNELKQDNKYLKSGIETMDKQIEQLIKQLAIATKALKRYSKDDYYSEGGGRSVNPYPHIARKALKEMKGVK